MPAKKKKFFTISEASKKLGISRQAVFDAIKEHRLIAKKGKITQTKIVKTTIIGYQITPESLQDYQVSELHREAGKKITDG